MITLPTKEFQEKYIDYLKKHENDTRKYLKQISEMLEKRTFEDGGWPEDFWLHEKKRLQTNLASLEESREFWEKTLR